MKTVNRKNFRKDFSKAMKLSLLESVKNNSMLTEAQTQNQIKYIKEQATYEQMLNLCFCENTDAEYHDKEVLEELAIMTIESVAQNMIRGSESVGDMFKTLQESVMLQEIDLPNPGAEDAAKEMAKYEKSIKKASMAGMKSQQRRAAEVGTKQAFEASPAGKVDKIVKQAKAAKEGFISKFKDPDFASKFVRGAGAVISIAALAAVAYYLYNRYWSETARACKGKAGDSFYKCYYGKKASSAKKVIGMLKKNKSNCRLADDKSKCEKSIERQVSRFEKKQAEAERMQKKYA